MGRERRARVGAQFKLLEAEHLEQAISVADTPERCRRGAVRISSSSSRSTRGSSTSSTSSWAPIAARSARR